MSATTPKTSLINVNGTNVENSTKIKYVEANPKRKNSAAHARFSNYMKSKTVEQFLKNGGTIADLRYDQTKGFVEITTK